MERIRVFLWQVVSDALPTKFMLFSRHIGADPMCLRCNQQVHETTIHVFERL